MRSIAIIWVFAFHCVYCSPYWKACFIEGEYNELLLAGPLAGALGVDMFFILSGFLIAYILIKEHKKYGSIDVAGFFRNRFIRIWFVLVVYAIVQFIIEHTSNVYKTRFPKTYGESIQRVVTTLTFTTNIAHDYTHVWSVAVEF